MAEIMDQISKEKFLCYENIRQSGVTNMWAVDFVIELSNGVLTEEDCLEIMKNYGKYKKLYLEGGEHHV